MVLNGRTLDGGYGSDIVWIDCDFDNHGGVATFVNHMGEVRETVSSFVCLIE